MASNTFKLGRGLFGTEPLAHRNETPIRIHWTTASIPTSGAITGHDPLTIFLRFLLSTGSGLNYSGSGTNYDTYQYGAGLGIPYQRVDITGIEALQALPEYDSNIKMFFLMTGEDKAKKFLQEELLRPYGMYMTVTNEGIITVKWPKNPEKYYVSLANNNFSVKVPSGGTTYNASIAAGVYTRDEMATAIDNAITAAAGGTWTVAYNTSTNKMEITHAGAADWDIIASSDSGWEGIGFDTLPHTGITDGVAEAADTATAKFTGRALTEDDIWDIKHADNRDDQVTSVLYMFDHDPKEKIFQTQRWYISAEDANLGGSLRDRMHVIKSKGLVSNDPGALGKYVNLWTHQVANGCGLTPAEVTSGGIDDDSMGLLTAARILDRYRQPPMHFRAKLLWTHNDLEVGDTIQLTYSPAGVFVDRELNADTLTSRTFELVRVHPNFQGGYVEIEALGHRDKDTTSVSISTVGTD